jgi:hypothetical protein
VKTILVYKVLYVKLRINSGKGVNLPVSGEKAQGRTGVKATIEPKLFSKLCAIAPLSRCAFTLYINK